ncbi:MAG: hypothetical protein J6I49_08645 [Bacteroidales bacterium]|nr:hypothetical protein [Bacteroidales bacterium]
MKRLLSHPFVARYGLLLLLAAAVVPALVSLFYDAFRIHWCDWWPTYNYFIGYEYGFGSRKLIGTLVGPLLPEVVTAKHIRLLVLPANVLMLLGAVWFVWRCLRAGGRAAVPVAVLTALYAVNPFSLTEWVTSSLSLGFMETYQLVATLVWLLLFLRWRGRWWYYVATLLVTTACCLVHHTFCCTLLPLYTALFVYDTLQDGRLHRGKAIAYGSMLALLLVLFVLLWRCSGMNIDMETLYSRIDGRANQDVLPDRDGLRMLYYLSNSDNASGRTFDHQRDLRFAIELLFMLPLLAILVCPWVVAARRAPAGAARWRYRLVPAIALLMTVPVFFMATDYTRWWTCWTFTLATLPLAAFATGDTLFRQALLQLGGFLRRHWWLPPLLAAYLVQFHLDLFEGMVESARLIDTVSTFLH